MKVNYDEFKKFMQKEGYNNNGQASQMMMQYISANPNQSHVILNPDKKTSGSSKQSQLHHHVKKQIEINPAGNISAMDMVGFNTNSMLEPITNSDLHNQSTNTMYMTNNDHHH